MSGLLHSGSPLVLGRRGRKCCPCVDVLTDGGPEAVTKQETEKVVEVELNSRRKEKATSLGEVSSIVEKHWRAPSPSKVAFGKACFEDLISCPQEAAASSKNCGERTVETSTALRTAEDRRRSRECLIVNTVGIGGSMDDPPCLGAPHPGDQLPRTKDANALRR